MHAMTIKMVLSNTRPERNRFEIIVAFCCKHTHTTINKSRTIWNKFNFSAAACYSIEVNEPKLQNQTGKL